MAHDTDAARAFIKDVNLDGTPRWPVPQDVDADATDVFNTAKAQAQVVGSTLLSFTEGVTAEARQAISDSALLAQLLANKDFAPESSPTEWYAAYLDVLENIGWVVQDQGWTDYTAKGDEADVQQKLIELLSVVLGAAGAAIAIVKSAVDALKSMTEGSSWLTIFSRETQHAHIARFQVGLAQKSGIDPFPLTPCR